MRVNTTDLQNSFGKYLALTEKEDIIITKNGKTVAKLIKYTDPENFFVREEAGEYKIPKKISYEEYKELVETSDQRYELIDGQVYLLASPSFNHQVIVNELAGQFYNFFKGKSCQSLTAPLDIKLFGHATKFEENPNVVQPDLVVICDQDKVNDKNKYEGVPSLIVEVLSPTTKGKDLVTKLNLYMESGVLEYWIIDLENEKIIQYSFKKRDIKKMNHTSKGNIIQSIQFEDLEIDLNDIFEGIR